MKKFYLALFAALLLPFAAIAADCNGYNAANCQKHGGSAWVVGGTQDIISGGTFTNAGAEVLSGTVDTHSMAFATGQNSNPLLKESYSDVIAASTVGTTIIASASSRVIYPTGALTIMASGTAAGATAITLTCSGGTKIVTWPIAELVDHVPVGIYASSVTVLGSPLTQGCPSGESIMVSSTGSALTTTTHVYVSLPYTIQ